MNYPFWDIPVLGSGWVIGVIAIFHVMISQFAVGGGLYLPMAEYKAMKEGRKDWTPQLIQHSKFFLLVTGIYGTVSGVGIWFAIGLTHPEATSTLIHNFVFGWAIEWVFFLVELTTIAVYYYTWNRIDPKLHLTVGWVYAVASFFTLVIINGILTFMLTPGDAWLAVAGSGAEASKFWNAFFNPTYWPSLLLRCCVCCSLAAAWALVTASRIDGDQQPELKKSLLQWTVKWIVPTFILTPFLTLWYLAMVPGSQRLLLSLGVDNITPGVFSTVTRMSILIVLVAATILFAAYFLAYRNWRELTLPQALIIVLLALFATGAGEYSREMLRKPYVIGRWMFSNGVRVNAVNRINQEGYLAHTQWIWHDSNSSYARGQAIFRGECGSCHTLTGYRPLTQLLAGRDRKSIENLIVMLHEYKPDSPYRKYMPPMTGTQQDLSNLVDFLNAQVNPPTQRAAAK